MSKVTVFKEWRFMRAIWLQELGWSRSGYWLHKVGGVVVRVSDPWTLDLE